MLVWGPNVIFTNKVVERTSICAAVYISQATGEADIAPDMKTATPFKP